MRRMETMDKQVKNFSNLFKHIHKLLELSFVNCLKLSYKFLSCFNDKEFNIIESAYIINNSQEKIK